MGLMMQKNFGQRDGLTKMAFIPLKFQPKFSFELYKKEDMKVEQHIKGILYERDFEYIYT